MSQPDAVQATADAQFESRYGQAALLDRYARARIRDFLVRQVATLIGTVVVWYVVNPTAAMVCVFLALAGEGIDLISLQYVRKRLRLGASLPPLLRFTAFTAGVQSLTIAVCVLLLLAFATTGEASLIALCFLMAGAVNAGFVMTHHRLASCVKLGVLSSCVPIYLVADVVTAGGFGIPQLIHLLQVAMLSYLTFSFVAFAVRSWKRRLTNERDLMQSAAQQELTNRKLLAAKKEAEQAAQAKSAFLATMSHEIRTPLNAVIGMSDLLAQTELGHEGRGYVDTIRTASTSLLGIINDVLDFSRLDAGQMAFEALPFAPSESISAAARLLMPLAQAKGLTVVIADDGSLPARASADEGRLRQILLNLMGNAIKFTEQGEVKVISRAEQTPDGWRMVIRVMDTGVGVRPDRSDAIFEVFQQADAATTRRFGGTGLGLPISRALARRMDGDIQLLQPDPDRHGATFELTVALKRAPAEASARGPGLVPVDKGIARPLRVILADDNETNRLLVQQLLKAEQVTLYQVVNGREALDLTARIKPDVVLMDMAMPELDGLEASRRIRTLDIPQPHIIALTANAFASDQAACQAAGMDDFLTKPIRKSVLIAALARASRLHKGVSQPGTDAVTGLDRSEGSTPWTSRQESGTTSGK
ncbi:response regulator [Sagittula sp. NFXS13]|uniref:hybrid sensor histidine kinase/response regulator n=1 Tax=Sagittula sp. NFXS13 TaxID=2819095 RepID=UPI0032DED28C